MAEPSSKKGSPAWRRGVERARAQAVALLKRIGPNADQLSDEERKKMHWKLAADLKRLVVAIDKHLAEIPAEKPPRSAGLRTSTRGQGRLR